MRTAIWTILLTAVAFGIAVAIYQNFQSMEDAAAGYRGPSTAQILVLVLVDLLVTAVFWGGVGLIVLWIIWGVRSVSARRRYDEVLRWRNQQRRAGHGVNFSPTYVPPLASAAPTNGGGERPAGSSAPLVHWQERLQRLDELTAAGSITAQERDAQRQRILNGL